MKVQVNNKEVEITPDSTLTQLTAQLELPVQGIAIAVNNKMIPRTEWEGFILHENDNLVIIICLRRIREWSVYNLSRIRPNGTRTSNRHVWHSKAGANGSNYA